MIKILRFFTSISILIFLAAILIVYAFLPDPSGLLFGGQGNIIIEISRDTFFYSALFIFVIIQILYIIFNRTILKQRIESPGGRMSTWIQGMILSVNLFIILMIIFIGLANNAVDYSYKSIHLVAYIAPSIVIVWLLTLPFFLFLRKE